MAEAVLNHISQGRFKAFSAGSSTRPGETPHPMAIEMLEHARIPTDGLHSKSWDEFALPNAQEMDLVITLCDDAAGEICPVWPGHPATAHWGFPDPTKAAGDDAHQKEAFRKTLHALHQRLELLINLPEASVEKFVLETHARSIAQHALA